jgi:hypothetical protein
VTTSKKVLDGSFQSYNQVVIASLTKDLDDVQDASFANVAKTKIMAIETTIKDYTEARQKLLGDRVGDPACTVASEPGIPPQLPHPASTGAARTTPDGKPVINPDDYWTSISVSVAESYDAAQSSSSANSFSLGASASWGLWTIGGSVSHSDSTSKVAKQMAHSSVSVTFDCLRVDIRRSWLRSELFYDSDIAVTHDTLCVT